MALVSQPFVSPMEAAITVYSCRYKSSAWEDPGNWSCGNIPDANTDVLIENDVTYFPELSSDASSRSVTVKPGASLNVKPGFNLRITK